MKTTFKNFDPHQDLSIQRKMFVLCFPEAKGQHAETVEHYQWKFHSFPNTPTSYEYVAYDGDQILGYYAAIPYKYSIDNKILTSGMVCDVMTHPKARGKGIFTKIGFHSTDDMEKKGVDFTTGYPIRPEVIPGHLKVGWNAPFKLPVYLKPLRSNDLLRSKKLSFLAPIINFFIGIYNLLIDLGTSADNQIEHKILNLDAFLDEEAYQEFIQAWYKEQKNFLIKDRPFLSWRLGSESEKYKIFCSYKNKKMVAMAIVKKTILNGISSLALLDLMVKTDVPKAASSLLRQLKSYAVQQKCDVLALMISRHWATKYQLIKNGFLKTPLSFTFITKRLNTSIDSSDFLEEKNWHLTWIDSDDL